MRWMECVDVLPMLAEAVGVVPICMFMMPMFTTSAGAAVKSASRHFFCFAAAASPAALSCHASTRGATQ